MSSKNKCAKDTNLRQDTWSFSGVEKGYDYMNKRVTGFKYDG